MAERRKPDPGRGDEGSEPNLDPHPLVERLLRSDEEAPSDLVVLTGYLGPSKIGDNVRLYTDLTFRTYYEIPRSAVRKTVAGPDEESPTQVWVDASAKIEVVQTTRQTVEAGYLAGSIASQFAGGRGAQAAARGGWGGPVCLTVVTANPTDCGPVCLTVVTANPTDCGGPVCLTVVTANPTDCGPICLTVVTANPTDCGRAAALSAQARAAGPAVAARPPQFCITLFTARPSNCDPQFCITLHTARPTWCGGGGGQVCLTVVTANPTDCGGGGGCQPIRTSNPTQCPICLTVVTANPTDCGGCQPFRTSNPTQCGPICLTLVTAVPTDCG